MTFGQATAALQRFFLERQVSGPAAHQIHYRPDAFRTYFREYFPSQALQDSCGVYLILDMDDRVLYIGKAAAHNLFVETYAKFNTPSRAAPLFPHHCWVDRKIDESVRTLIETGEVRLAFITVDSGAVATELERYLHKLAVAADGKLPPLNLRIG